MSGSGARRTLRRRTAAPVTALVAVAASLSLAAGCGAGPGGDDDEDRHQLTVFAAASLASAFTHLAGDFERDHPGVRVRLSFDGSSGVVDQLAGGAPADVFASADPQTMNRAVAAGLVAGDPAAFATNVLTLITPPGNPAGITGLDGSLDGSRLVVCADGVPCGTATRALAADAGVGLAPVSEETTVTDVRGKVTSGEADVGIVYATEARAAGRDVEQIAIPGARAHQNRYLITTLDRAGRGPNGAGDPAAGDARGAGTLARQFVDAVTGPGGRAVLADHGFGPP